MSDESDDEIEDIGKLNNTHAAEGEEGEGPWLMSFADMVTLLMCFFILFFQTEQGNIQLENPESVLEKLQALQKLLGFKDSSEEDVLDSNDPMSASGAFGSIESFSQDMTRVSRDLDLLFSIGLTHPGEVELTFLNTRFFKSGRAELTVKAQKMLQNVAARLKKIADSAEVIIEGHTDSDPIKSRTFPSNWELSSARASTVVRLLSKKGLKPAKMMAIGRAEFSPIVPEKGLRGAELREVKALNRRIVIKIRHIVFNDGVKVTPPKSTPPNSGPQLQ